MRWAGHVARKEDGRSAYRIRWGAIREREHLEDLGVDGIIILTWILKKCGGSGPGLIRIRIGTVGGFMWKR
jgi:hypothetical protein